MLLSCRVLRGDHRLDRRILGVAQSASETGMSEAHHAKRFHCGTPITSMPLQRRPFPWASAKSAPSPFVDSTSARRDAKGGTLLDYPRQVRYGANKPRLESARQSAVARLLRSWCPHSARWLHAPNPIYDAAMDSQNHRSIDGTAMPRCDGDRPMLAHASVAGGCTVSLAWAHDRRCHEQPRSP